MVLVIFENFLISYVPSVVLQKYNCRFYTFAPSSEFIFQIFRNKISYVETFYQINCKLVTGFVIPFCIGLLY